MNHLNLVAMIFSGVGVAVCIAMNRRSSRLRRDAKALLAEVRRNHATSDAWVAEEREACAVAAANAVCSLGDTVDGCDDPHCLGTVAASAVRARGEQ